MTRVKRRVRIEIEVRVRVGYRVLIKKEGGGGGGLSGEWRWANLHRSGLDGFCCGRQAGTCELPTAGSGGASVSCCTIFLKSLFADIVNLGLRRRPWWKRLNLLEASLVERALADVLPKLVDAEEMVLGAFIHRY
ncbi:hypothetical protein HPP92_020298 [Vanilla planifolia]|uniref:Uncharacterized protein n=1 Tax=Vanilla planifolia TaxID=51239 RepID=A0A835Q2I7_VANPL|nr:hypothetical protein HPP92_020298 [Vanilla planifolia]